MLMLLGNVLWFLTALVCIGVGVSGVFNIDFFGMVPNKMVKPMSAFIGVVGILSLLI